MALAGRLIIRLALAPRPAACARPLLARAAVPSRLWHGRSVLPASISAPQHLGRRFAPLCAAAKEPKEPKAPKAPKGPKKKKEPNVLPASLPKALLFDCDGVLADTERDGHRVCFNAAFKQKGLDCEWGEEAYHGYLETGGGKERMTKFFREKDNEHYLPASARSEPGLAVLVKDLHAIKTKLFTEMVAKGEVPPRPGVNKLMNDALNAGVKVAVCSTSNESSVRGVLQVVLGERVKEVRIFAGDVVPAKKPAPDIYQLAARELKVDPKECVVIEDTEIGVKAAKGASMRCVVTYNGYTKDENFSEAQADAVFDGIGAKGWENFLLEDLTVPNGAFWVDDEGIEDEEGDSNGNGVKPKKKKKATKVDDDDEDAEEEE